MLLLDQLARGATIAILAVMAVLLGRERHRIPSARIAIAFFVTIAAHLILTSPAYAARAWLDPLFKTAALAAPGVFFFFSRALFEDDGRFALRDALIAGLLIAAGWLRTTPIAGFATILYYAASLALLAFALGRVVRDFPSDLVEPRRRLRAAFTTFVGLLILVVIGAEILVPSDRRTQALETLKSRASSLPRAVAGGGRFVAVTELGYFARSSLLDV